MDHTIALKQNHLFQRLYHKGKSSAGKALVVYCRKNGLNYNRLGITTGKKLGHAVVRNKIRRRVREAYRLSESRYRLGWDIVVVARSRAAFAEYREIADCLFAQSEKLGLIRKEEAPHEAAAPSPDSLLS